jgi:DNA-directed RNA polymerase specialized sigma24 family protein
LRQQQAWELRQEGLFLKEIAFRMGIKTTTVESHLARVKQRLSEEGRWGIAERRQKWHE